EIFFRTGSGTAFSIALFARTNPWRWGSYHWRRIEPAFARSHAKSDDRGGMDGRNTIAFEHDAGACRPVSTQWPSRFSASPRHVVYLANSPTRVWLRTGWSISTCECDP